MIEGFALGHHTADGPGWLTGTTVVLCEGAGAVGGVAVRGGGPGTRETDLLDPTAMVERVNAVVLTGGSAYGLAAADGVMGYCEQHGLGFPVGAEQEQVVPIVPAAVIFDLARSGDFAARPTAEFGRLAAEAAALSAGADPAVGNVGAGTGARCGGLRGGFGYAEARLADGTGVAAAVVVNATGSAVDPYDGRLRSDRHRLTPAPSRAEQQALARAEQRRGPSLATTIAVVLTDATLTKAAATKVASVAHDGLARAVAPVHSMTDGDTVFALASGRRPATAGEASIQHLDELLAVGADVFTDACWTALTAAAPRAGWATYASLAPSCGLSPDRD